MKNCTNGRFLNEQTYLDTVCHRQKCKPPKKEKPQSCEYVQYTCQTKCGRICLRHSSTETNLEIGINHHCNPHEHHDCNGDD